MTEREKLINLMSTAGWNLFTDSSSKGIIADHLLANGVIVPPCKVGDVVYFIQDKKIYEGAVILIRPFIHKDHTNFFGNVQYEYEDPFFDDGRMRIHEVHVAFQEFGNNTIAYFSREDAEKALKGVE